MERIGYRLITHMDEEFCKGRVYPEDNSDEAGAKPSGLWFSVLREDGIDGWVSICRKRGWKLYRYTHEVTFSPSANVLWLRDSNAITEFNAQFGGYRQDARDWGAAAGSGRREPAIRWDQVKAKGYDAVVGVPDVEALGSQHWYRAWECPSGCVWNLKAVKLRKFSCLERQVYLCAQERLARQ
jgi:hypothetical protein